MPTPSASCNHSTLQGDLVCLTCQGNLKDAVPGCSDQSKSGDDDCTVRPSDNYFSHKGNRKSNLDLGGGYCNKDDDCASGFTVSRGPDSPPCMGVKVREYVAKTTVTPD